MYSVFMSYPWLPSSVSCFVYGFSSALSGTCCLGRVGSSTSKGVYLEIPATSENNYQRKGKSEVCIFLLYQNNIILFNCLYIPVIFFFLCSIILYAK